MRDVALVLIFALFALLSLRRPHYAALMWVWIGLMNPHRLTYGFAYDLPFAMATVGVVALAIALKPSALKIPRGAAPMLLLLFVLWMAITTFAAIVPEPSWTKYREVLKIFGMCLIVTSLIHNREHIMGLVWVMTASIAFYGAKGGLFTIAHGGSFRVWGPPNSLVEGNNELAVAVIVSIPFLYVLARQAKVAKDFVLVSWIPEKWLRRGLYLSILLCAAAALGSQSRGALLAIGAMGAMLWWRSRSKLVLALAFIAILPVAFSFMPDEWFARMNTIGTYEQDLSALQRLNAWKTAINIANDRVLGAGFATANMAVFSRYSPLSGPEWVFVAHSIYFQVLGDHGYIGLALYLGFWLATYRLAGRLVKRSRNDPELAWVTELANMAKVSIVGFAAGGAFLSLAYWDMPYYIMVALVATDRMLKLSQVQADKTSPAPAHPGGALARGRGHA
jgi:putative inorganic carbon (hco3(-)) transporter